jgi:hypothetical protein
MPSKIPMVVITLAIVVWLGSILVFQAGAPPAVRVAFIVAVAVGIPSTVFWLMANQGWTTLAKRYRAAEPFKGGWRSCPTGQMARVSVDHPDFNIQRLRLVSTLFVGTSSMGLHLSVLFSRLPLLNLLFPDVAIPWSAVRTARTYEAPGWVTPASEPGAQLQLSYDPNYTGKFVELEVGEPPVYIQLPLAILGSDAARLAFRE